ncbi:hypothetical protein F4803DRAFT_313051 [Xylaria telfairii]|nr:hypothetical protein F4803DRAFT_313051 [Xylaria telfairii]
MDPSQVAIIKAHPFGTHLDKVRALFNEIAKKDLDTVGSEDKLDTVGNEDKLDTVGSEDKLDTVGNEVLQNTVSCLLSLLQHHPVSHFLRSRTGRGTLKADLLQLHASLEYGELDLNRIRPLLNAVLTKASDTNIWEQAYYVVTESTPPRKPISSIQSTPWRLTTSSVVNSSKKRNQIDEILRNELGVMYVDVPNFYEAFWGSIPQLETASEDIFQKCTQGPQPLFQQGWTGWPGDAKQESVLVWLANIIERFLQWAQKYRPTTRRPLALPDTPLEGSVARRKLDFGLVDNPKADKAGKYYWLHVLVPGELKSNPYDDRASKAHFDIAKYVKEVFTAQPTRRFVLAFTLCGSWMRLWEFDRLGGIASEKFNINIDGKRFVSTILGFLWMDHEALGFDPTIIKSKDQQYIEIQQSTKTERLVLDRPIRSAHSIVGRATICWKAYLGGDKSKPFVVKDSWQFPERDEEGELLQQATRQEVTNVARYYYHETVCVKGKDDDIQRNVRRGLDITKASNYRTGRVRNLQAVAVEAISRNSSTGSNRPSSQAGALLPPSSKRSSSQVGALLPPSKRPCSESASPTKHDNEPPPNRIHRRIVLRDYGGPIYKASSRAALLGAFEGCIRGHESLYKKAGLLHRDISINNLMISQGNTESLSSFLIDLDLAIEVNRTKSSGAKGITGTRAFMAIGVLKKEGHTFMDDLESFFWVLFWICIHYNQHGQGRETDFTKWNEVNTETLAELKKAVICDDGDFLKTASEHFTFYYKTLIPWVDKLRRAVFPNGRRWRQVDETLYSQMTQILRDGQNDPLVLVS